MPGWQGSDRGSRLPPDWPARRKRVLTRDGYRCTHIRVDTDARCTAPATDVDHVNPGDDHAESNLTSLCGWHHDKKSGREGGTASAARRRRPPKKHPGVL